MGKENIQRLCVDIELDHWPLAGLAQSMPRMPISGFYDRRTFYPPIFLAPTMRRAPYRMLRGRKLLLCLLRKTWAVVAQ
jgi:hypothetical protein